MYNLDTIKSSEIKKGVSIASAPRQVDKVWILNKDIPGPKYDVTGNLLKAIPKERQKRILRRRRKEERCVLVDKSKIVPDPGKYDVIQDILEEGKGYTLGHKPLNLTTEQAKAKLLRKNIETLPLKARRKKLD